MRRFWRYAGRSRRREGPTFSYSIGIDNLVISLDIKKLKMAKKNAHIASLFDGLLRSSGYCAKVIGVAIKCAVAWQDPEKMESKNISKTRVAELMDTSCSALD